MKTMQMQSCVHENATVECTLIEIELPEPGPDDVVVEIEAAPINPSDLGLMFGAADLSTVRAVERDRQPSVLLDVPDAAMRAMAPRIGHWMAVGNEGSGSVIAAGESDAAQALMGQRVGMFGGVAMQKRWNGLTSSSTRQRLTQSVFSSPSGSD